MAQSNGTQNGTSKEDPLQYYEDKLKSIEETIDRAEKAQMDMIQEVEDECKSKIHDKTSTFKDEFESIVQSRLHTMGDGYEDVKSQIITKQTDVLRTNKCLRDVSRSLGPDWRPVFQHLMASQPPEVLEAELRRIEKAKPVIQAYKALSTWKDLAGEEFHLNRLVDALKVINNYDLIEMVLDIMESEGDSLIMLDKVGKGVRRGSDVPVAGQKLNHESEAGTEGMYDHAEEGTGETTNGEEIERPSIQRPIPVPEVEDPLSNGSLLKLSRELISSWKDIGKKLGISEEDLQEIRDAETGYQAAFKMLFSWRDNLDADPTDDDALRLARVIEDCGHRNEAKEIRNMISQST